MAKCPICNSRKGKRRCIIVDGLICSLCCGNTRKEDTCSECVFYRKPKRNYNDAPRYAAYEMDGNDELESYGNSIEGALCSYDKDHHIDDGDAIRIIELLIDKYHFKDKPATEETKKISDGYEYLEDIVRRDLNELDDERIVKILGVIRFVAKRRTEKGREYMEIIHQYVGQRIAPGIRLLQG